ncbi:MAG: DUF4192 domain-containing protein [Candidatus Nanopelagicales bacterium]
MNVQNSILKPKGPASLLAAIPYLLGFMPLNSLVLVAFNSNNNQVVVAIRIDLAELAQAQLVENAMEALRKAKENSSIDGVLTALYAESNWPQYRPTINELLKAQNEVCEISEALWVEGDRYGSLLCEDIECWPIEGFALPSDTSLEKLQLISQGKSALASKEEIEQYFISKPENPKLVKAITKLEKSKNRAKNSNWNENLYNRGYVNLLNQSEDLNELAQAEIILISKEISLRDKLISEVLREIQISQEPLNLLHSLKTRLLPLIQNAPKTEAKAVLTILGIWLWQLGESVWAQAAVKQALNFDASYRLGLLTMSAIKSGLPPWKFADCFGPI